MLRRAIAAGLLTLGVLLAMASNPQPVRAAGRGQPTDWSRFYHYPYVYYPHNFRQMPQSYDHLYYRYAPELRIPVYNKSWINFYPRERPYHRGHHFILDVF